jgi:hypothetical protein
VKVAEFACWEMGKNLLRKLRKTTPIIIMMKFAHCSVCYIRLYLFILDVFRNIYLNISFYTSPNILYVNSCNQLNSNAREINAERVQVVIRNSDYSGNIFK